MNPDEPGWNPVDLPDPAYPGSIGPERTGWCRMRRQRARDASRIISDFAGELSTLRVRAGNPSYERLGRLTHETVWPQCRSTIYDKLASKTVPDELFVKAFVQACRIYAMKQNIEFSEPEFSVQCWVSRYQRFQRELWQAENAHRTSIAQEHPVSTIQQPITQWNPVQLGVHPVIQVPRSLPRNLELPKYFERRHDRRLRKVLTELTGRPRFVALVGASSTGKTRTAYEAVIRCFPEWRLYVPGAVAELIELLAGDPVEANSVIWLDEARNFLNDPDAALALCDLLNQLNGDIVVLATMWPSHWTALYAAKERAEDTNFQARRMLDLAIRIDVPEGFTRAEVDLAARRGRIDPLMAAAVRDCGPRREITQVLAAGPWLAHHFDSADPYARAILTAAMDARRLGYGALAPDSYLREAAVGHLDTERRAGIKADWFASALRENTAKVEGALAPLTPVRLRPGIGEPDGYRIADFLDQRGREILRGKAVPAEVWNALIGWATEPASRIAVARAASTRSLLQQAYVLAAPAADAGIVEGMRIIAAQAQRWERHEMATLWWTKAAERNDSFSMCHLARQREDRGEQDAANEWWQRAAGLKNPYAIWQFADRLDRSGQHREAEKILRRAAQGGEPYALQELIDRLEREHRFAEAEDLCRNVVRQGHASSAQAMTTLMQLTEVLTRQGRGPEAERALRKAAEQGHCPAMNDLARLLEREGRTAEATHWWTKAADEGYAPAVRHLVDQHRRTGEDELAEQWLQSLSDAGDTYAMWHLADLYDRRGCWPEAEAVLSQAVELGDEPALRRLIEYLVQADRIADAESLLRAAVENAHASALGELQRLLEHCRRGEEARQLGVFGIEPGGGTATPWGLGAG